MSSCSPLSLSRLSSSMFLSVITPKKEVIFPVKSPVVAGLVLYFIFVEYARRPVMFV